MERDYAELIKALRFAFDQPCYSCVLGEKCNWGDFCFFKRSADAIEELLKENGELENSGRVLMAAFARLKEKVPKWISVEERLPETRSSILGQKSNKVIVAFRFDDGTQGTDTAHTLNGDWVFEDRIVVVNRTVTHWMPLPKAPKEVE